MSRRSLGAAVSKHAKKRDEAVKDIRYATSAMHDSVRSGDCKRAVSQLAAGAQAWGEFRAHHTAAGGSLSDAGINMMNNAYHEQRDRVLKACVRTNPTELGRSRAPRRRRSR